MNLPAHYHRGTGAGRPWQEAVIVEAHVGTFTKQGTYRAMIDRLDHLVETGITALELMPLADSPARRNWGYDGVLWYAPDSAMAPRRSQGADRRGASARADGDARRGLQPFRPRGNYLGRYAPSFFTKRTRRWGSAIDYRVKKSTPLRSRMRAALAARLSLRWAAARCRQLNRRAGRLSLLHDISAAAGQLAAETGRHSPGAGEWRQPRQHSGRRRGPVARKISRAMNDDYLAARADDRREAGLLLRLSALADI